ncbi:MAG: class I SAM-dependent rRNA methyltransferase [Anaerolineae bacterium]|nr:class I SAM-dependent rRNA methyltransferase [Anaerolineae bacterium]MDH7473360.1 class I SAM-dependent rRNA methyltransferase [Anaerolineae bacterium]
MSTVILKKGRAKPVLLHHPWVFSGAIARIEGEAQDGDVVVVRDAGGNFLAQGMLNRRSQIAVRLLSWDESGVIDSDFWRTRLARAIAARKVLTDDPGTTAYRLVNAEADLLPGLVVDRYDDILVVQFLTLGMDVRKREIVSLLAELVQPRGIYERCDEEMRAKEGLLSQEGCLWGEEPPDLLQITENGLHFWVDIKRGQKTGFYLDQRENRRRVQVYCPGHTVLNAFAYTGGFAVYAAAAGAEHITNIDSSAEALDLAKRNMALNGFAARDDEFVQGDVFQILRYYRDQGRSFDVVILDPPKFAHTQSQVERAARGYKDINLLALQLVRPGGALVTFSCSGAISADLFQKIVFGASVDAGRDVQIIERLSQGVDHPALLSFPESQYLKGLVCRVW